MLYHVYVRNAISVEYNRYMTEVSEHTHTTLSWSAYEHEHIERDEEWYWAVGIIATCLALVSAIFGNYLFGLVIIMAAVSLALVSRHPPELTHFEITERGLRVGNRIHHYHEIIGFWVEDEEGEHPTLLVDTTKPLSPNIIIPLVDIDPYAVRAYLKEHVQETPMKEPFAHKLLEFFGL